MSDQKVWFGPRGWMRWIPAPAVSMPSTTEGYRRKMNFLGGGARVRKSSAKHREYVLTWNLKSRDEIRPILDMDSSMYGDAFVYFADPFAMDKNMLNQSFSMPYLSGIDGIILDGRTERPQLIPTDANSYNYPAYSAIFNVPAPVAGQQIYQQYVPIPPGYTAWVGAHGTAGTGGVVQAIPAIGGATGVGAAVNLTLLPSTTATRFNYSLASTAAHGVIIRLGGTGTITLSGIMVQVLPTGETPADGEFISGQGAMGLSFSELEYTPYSAALDQVGLVARLTEDEPWSFVPNLGV